MEQLDLKEPQFQGDHQNEQIIDSNLEEYEQLSEQQILVQFARHSYPLIGAIIDGNVIKGQFGLGQIQQARNQRLVILQNHNLKVVNQVSKIIITKSIFRKNQTKSINREQIIQYLGKNAQIDIEPIISAQKQQKQAQNFKQDFSQENFFSKSSEQSAQQERIQHHVRKSRKKKKITLQSGRQNKNSKHILKKKLKFLSNK